MKIELIDFRCGCEEIGGEFTLGIEITPDGSFKVRQLICAECGNDFEVDDIGIIKGVGSNKEESDD